MQGRAARELGQAARAAAPPVLELAVHRKTDAARRPLGTILQEMGALSQDGLVRALEIQASQAGFLGDILLAHGMITETDLTTALSRQFSTSFLTSDAPLPDRRLIEILGVRRCLALYCLPWERAGDVTVVACARPAQFGFYRPELERIFGPVAMVLISETDLHATLLKTQRTRLKLWAETCVDERESCRMLQSRSFGRVLRFAVLVIAALVLLAPQAALLGLTLIATGFLLLTSLLKLAAAIAVHRRPPAPEPRIRLLRARRPIVSIMVPLYKEPRVIPRLINRLSRLTWPRELLDILLVVEEHDHATRAALDACALPRWMRVVPVPDAPLKTKPRALNYAMLFARGAIIGVYDAEDAPEPDQIHRVVKCFQDGPPDLACVQGALDFYNARTNWLSRCFTIEYATWFRIVLPGMQRLGLAVPLGGTTLFFRRDILESLGGWDAHNVTEDADLGIRLARHGYYTQLLDTVTLEEANCRAVPWVKQRSRWLKGYAVTWLVHMRAPRALWRQLGAWRFFGVQLLFLGTLVQFMFAPLLWSFWLMLAGLSHPLQASIGGPVMLGFFAVFVMSEAVTLSVGYLALGGHRHRHLRLWLPTLHGYFPLAVLAVYKALWELISAPFYWDKTAHGEHGAACDQVTVAGGLVASS
ncbi:glycosyltransferase [Natronohydrobacter thiooxidans]|uniref:glycosyltransferase n=1 Tax=Natronohydrobacter thiooxidans TaxID=87172 RepID=UPI000A03DB13|nr:glycosyltransferase [Natronohydrobacter thiooxidans]